MKMESLIISLLLSAGDRHTIIGGKRSLLVLQRQPASDSHHPGHLAWEKGQQSEACCTQTGRETPGR